MYKFFIPLTNFTVDLDRLSNEIFAFWKIEDDKTNKDLKSPSFTTSLKYVDDTSFNFSRYSGVSSAADPGNWPKNPLKVYSDGEYDHNLTHWPKILENSYMKELGDYYAKLLNVTRYRARASYISTLENPHTFKLHNDPHTPHRLHFAIKTDPTVQWKFVNDENEYFIHQPSDNFPTLIETGSTQHQIVTNHKTIRIHFWYQYYDPIDADVIRKICN